MNKILIVGNSGSGKSWLAQKLKNLLNLNAFSLDDIHWQSGGYNAKRTPEQIKQALDDIGQQTHWVVEGVFGGLAEQLTQAADVFIFLDMPWSLCESALLQRGSKSSEQLDAVEAENNFQELLTWAEKYSQRSSKNSFSFHQEMYEQFTSTKYQLNSRQAVSDFLVKLKVAELKVAEPHA